MQLKLRFWDLSLCEESGASVACVLVFSVVGLSASSNSVAADGISDCPHVDELDLNELDCKRLLAQDSSKPQRQQQATAHRSRRMRLSSCVKPLTPSESCGGCRGFRLATFFRQSAYLRCCRKHAPNRHQPDHTRGYNLRANASAMVDVHNCWMDCSQACL